MNNLQRQLRDLIFASEGREAGFMAEDRIITLNRLLMAMGGDDFIIDLVGKTIEICYRDIKKSAFVLTRIDLTHTNILDNDESVLAKLVDLLTNK